MVKGDLTLGQDQPWVQVTGVKVELRLNWGQPPGLRGFGPRGTQS